MTPVPITFEAVRKSFGAYLALDNVSLAVAAGEFLTLLGPSGSGKTTLLMALAGFVRPDAGHIRLGERDITRLAPNLRDIGIVFQNYALFPHMTVRGNVEYPLRLRKTAADEMRQRVEAALDRVQLGHLADRDIAALSGGQRQRVALARAIVYEPRVMLMDEPLSALDKNLRESMQYEIRRLHDALGVTTIYVTHDQREALTMSDRIAVMDKGRIQQIDAPQAIYHRPATRFVAEFMGEANILPAAALRHSPGAGPKVGSVVIRAESFHLSPEGLGDAAVALDGRLVAKAFRGENWLLTVMTAAGQEVAMSIPATRAAGCADLAEGAVVAAFAAAGTVHPLAEVATP